eukprot:6206746-Pyramimonas_sp.AAC.1
MHRCCPDGPTAPVTPCPLLCCPCSRAHPLNLQSSDTQRGVFLPGPCRVQCARYFARALVGRCLSLGPKTARLAATAAAVIAPASIYVCVAAGCDGVHGDDGDDGSHEHGDENAGNGMPNG